MFRTSLKEHNFQCGRHQSQTSQQFNAPSLFFFQFIYWMKQIQAQKKNISAFIENKQKTQSRVVSSNCLHDQTILSVVESVKYWWFCYTFVSFELLKIGPTYKKYITFSHNSLSMEHLSKIIFFTEICSVLLFSVSFGMNTWVLLVVLLFSFFREEQ